MEVLEAISPTNVDKFGKDDITTRRLCKSNKGWVQVFRFQINIVHMKTCLKNFDQDT